MYVREDAAVPTELSRGGSGTVAAAGQCLSGTVAVAGQCLSVGQEVVQELVEVVNRSKGVVLMAPPADSTEAQASLATLLSALKPKQKVCLFPCLYQPVPAS